MQDLCRVCGASVKVNSGARTGLHRKWKYNRKSAVPFFYFIRLIIIIEKPILILDQIISDQNIFSDISGYTSAIHHNNR